MPSRRKQDHLHRTASAHVERFAFAKEPGDPGRPVNHYSFARSPEVIGERIATWALDRVSGRRPSA